MTDTPHPQTVPPPLPPAIEARLPNPRLKWRTLGDYWATTTAEGWEYRIRYNGRFTSVRVTPAGAEAFVWTCASLPQAKFSAFSDVRSRRLDAIDAARRSTPSATPEVTT